MRGLLLGPDDVFTLVTIPLDYYFERSDGEIDPTDFMIQDLVGSNVRMGDLELMFRGGLTDREHDIYLFEDEKSATSFARREFIERYGVDPRR